MSRASVASVVARATAWRTLAFALPSIRRASPGGREGRISFSEWQIGRLLPVAVIGFVILAGLLSWRASNADGERIVADASSYLELLSSVVADDIDRSSRADGGDAGAVIARIAATQRDSSGLAIFVADETGRTLASLSRGAGAASTRASLVEALGASEQLTVFADKAGVMRIVLPQGDEALATVRSLANGGQVAVVQTLAPLLSGWSEARLRTMVLVLAVGTVLTALTFGYAWQTRRASEADVGCRTMRERVDMVLARGRCGLWDWDLSGGYVDWSLSMFELLGMAPRDKALGFAEVNALIHPGDGGLTEMARLATLAQGGSIDHLFRLRHAGGAYVWLRAKAEVVEGAGGSPHLVGIAIDVTETMALEERSARADARLRDAIEAISEAFVVWDADNRLVMCNSKFQRFHNLPSDAVTPGTPYPQVMERGTAPKVHSQTLLGDAGPQGAREFEAQLGDGRWLQIDERRTKDGGFVSVGTDITALKLHEEKLLESERQLLGTVADLKKSRQLLSIQAQELSSLAERYREQKADAESASRAKSDFLANMSHELRTPLNAIIGFSEVMMTEAFGTIGSPLYVDYSKHIHSSGHSLGAMITDILEMAHLDSGRVRLQREELPVDEAIEAAVRSVSQAAAGAKITIDLEPRSALVIDADRNALTKVLAILLNNSVKYTPAGGSVSVRARVMQGQLALSVEDNGIGISPEALPRLGQPFEQAALKLNDGMRGSGLGLAIARSLVELHGGRMQIASKVDHGTTVLVLFPGETIVRSPLQLATATARPAVGATGDRRLPASASQASAPQATANRRSSIAS